jgi:hypothetical protein
VIMPTLLTVSPRSLRILVASVIVVAPPICRPAVRHLYPLKLDC